MSTWFSHLSSEPELFGLDLRPYLEEKFADEENFEYPYYTDSHDDYILYPVGSAVLVHLAIYYSDCKVIKERKYRVWDDAFSHFHSSCLSYFYNEDSHPTNFDYSWLNYDSDFVEDRVDDYNEFHLYVKNENQKVALVNLFLNVVKEWVKYTSYRKELTSKMLKGMTEEEALLTVEEFLNNLIKVSS